MELYIDVRGVVCEDWHLAAPCQMSREVAHQSR